MNAVHLSLPVSLPVKFPGSALAGGTVFGMPQLNRWRLAAHGIGV